MEMTLKKYLKNGCLWLVLLFVLVSAQCFAAEPLKSKRVIKVAFPQAYPISITYSDGSRDGVIFDWLMEIAKYTGWEYEFVTDELGPLFDALYAGEVDIMGGMLKTPWAQISENCYFPDYIAGYNKSLLFFAKEDKDIQSFDLRTLNNKSIGVFSRAESKIRRLQNILDFHGLNCELKYYDNDIDYSKSLDNKEVDLLLGSDIFDMEKYNVAIEFDSEPYYIVANKKDPELCKQLNQAIKKVYSVNPNFAKEAYTKYSAYEYNNTANLTPEELDFVKKSKTLKVALPEECFPFYYKKNGTDKGIVLDIFDLISRQQGLKFEYVLADSYEKAIDMVKDGRADLLGYFTNENTTANSQGLLLTKSYMVLNSIILRNKNAQFPNAGNRVAVVKGTNPSRQLDYGEILYYDNYQQCLKAVDSGKSDFTIVPANAMESLYINDYYANLAPIVDSPKIYLSIGLPLDANIRLYSVLSKSIVNLTEEKTSEILSNNILSVGVSKMSVKTLFYSNPILAIAVFISFIMMLCLIFFLHIRFRMKSEVMHFKLQEIEAVGKIRSEFLSRMSHEIRTPLNAIIGLLNIMKLSGKSSEADKDNLGKIDSSAKFLLSLVNDILDMSKIENGKMRIEAKPFSLTALTKQLENIFLMMSEVKGLSLKMKSCLLNSNFIGDELRLKQILTNLLSNAYKFTKSGGHIVLTVQESAVEDGKSQLLFCVKDTGIGIAEEELERIFGSFEQALQNSKRDNHQGTGLGLSISRNLVQLMGGDLQVRSKLGAGSEFFFTISLSVYDGELEVDLEEDNDNNKVYESLQGKHILLAEDNDLNAEIAIVLLEMQGIVVDRVIDGQLAVDKFSSQPVGTYDLILMDLQMPVKNGLEAAIEIRTLERPDAQTIPIIAMTANTMQEDQDGAYRAGMNGFIPKPFDVEQLYKSVEKFF